jgi:hypothetical protein
MRLTTSLPSCAECHEICEPMPPGTLWATSGLLRDSFTFYVDVLQQVSLDCSSPGLCMLNSKTGDDNTCNTLSRYHASQFRQRCCRGVRAFHSFSPQLDA